MRIKSVTPPALPLASRVYEPQYQNALINVLRLFFNKLTNFTSTLAGATGGGTLAFPYGQFSSQTTQTVAAIDTPTLLLLETTDFANGMYAATGDGVHVEEAGLYQYNFSLQLENPTTSIHEVTFWLRHDGVDEPYTATVVSIPAKHGAISGFVTVSRNYFIELEAAGYVELWWASTSTSVTLPAIAPQVAPYAHPGVPSTSVTMSFVSASL